MEDSGASSVAFFHEPLTLPKRCANKPASRARPLLAATSRYSSRCFSRLPRFSYASKYVRREAHRGRVRAPGGALRCPTRRRSSTTFAYGFNDCSATLRGFWASLQRAAERRQGFGASAQANEQRLPRGCSAPQRPRLAAIFGLLLSASASGRAGARVAVNSRASDVRRKQKVYCGGRDTAVQ